MSVFTLKIANLDVTEFVHQDSLNEWNQIAEAGSIWDFYTDSFSVTLDKSVLPKFFGATWDNLAGFTVADVTLDYYGNRVFAGVCSNASYDFKSDEIDLEFDSIGKVLKSFTIASGSNLLKNDNPQGESIQDIAAELVTELSTQVARSGKPITYSGQYNIVESDFAVLQNINATQLNLLLITSLVNAVIGARYPDFRLLTIDVDDLRYALKRDDEGTYWLAFYIERADDNPHVWLAQMGDGGFTGRLLYDIVQDTSTIPGGYRLALDVLDNAILNSLISQFNLPSNWTPDYAWPSSENVYYAFDYNGFIWKAFRVIIDEEDRVRFEYAGDTSVATFIKDVAKIFNVFTNFEPDGTINFISRKGNPEVIIVGETPIDLSFEVEKRDDERFEIPQAFKDFILSSNRNDIIGYYDQYLAGTFYLYDVVIPKESIPTTAYPLMLKNLKIPINGIFIDIGVIKEITYEEDLIRLKTERAL